MISNCGHDERESTLAGQQATRQARNGRSSSGTAGHGSACSGIRIKSTGHDCTDGKGGSRK